jgi:hypothetical protein
VSRRYPACAPVVRYDGKDWIVSPALDHGWLWLNGGHAGDRRIIKIPDLLAAMPRPPSRAVWDVLREAIRGC